MDFWCPRHCWWHSQCSCEWLAKLQEFLALAHISCVAHGTTVTETPGGRCVQLQKPTNLLVCVSSCWPLALVSVRTRLLPTMLDHRKGSRWLHCCDKVTDYVLALLLVPLYSGNTGELQRCSNDGSSGRIAYLLHCLVLLRFVLLSSFPCQQVSCFHKCIAFFFSS